MDLTIYRDMRFWDSSEIYVSDLTLKFLNNRCVFCYFSVFKSFIILKMPF